MKKDPTSTNKIVEANIDINNQLEDGKVHEPVQASSEAEKANIELQNQFNHDEHKDIRTSPAAIITPQ